MWAVVGAAVLAGGLGLLANAALMGPEYLPRLRVLFLGAAALAYVGTAVFIWLKAKGLRRIGYLLLALAAIRISYVPALHGGLLVAGWIEWIGHALDGTRLGAPVHYALGCFTAAFASLAALVLLAAAAHPQRAPSIVVFVVYAAAGLLAFSHADDRTPLPHAITAEDLQPAAEGPDYLDLAEENRAPARTRVLAALYGVVDALMPRRAWAGIVRTELHARFRAAPDASLLDRVTSIEGALRTARTEFRTSPRTPPE